MISTLSSSISEKLCSANVISRDEQELYSYGFFLLLSRGIFFAVAAVFGILFGTFWESILFYILFSTLRGYAGGIHASKEAVCMISTTFSLLLASAGIRRMELSGCVEVSAWMLLLGSLAIFLMSPLDSEEKPLNDSERRYYRRITRGIVLATTMVAFCSMAMRFQMIMYVAAFTLTLESILLIAGKVKFLCVNRKRGSRVL